MIQAVKYITTFPLSTGIKYDENLWKQQHGNSLVIINCFAADIFYPRHWTPLSFKFAFGGKEYYKMTNTTYTVNDDRFLILNYGQEYESFIPPGRQAESLTINYTQYNIHQFLQFAQKNAQELLDEPFPYMVQDSGFVEKLYKPDYSIRKLVDNLRVSIKNGERKNDFYTNEIALYLLMSAYRLHENNQAEISLMKASRASTRQELFARLSVAKDFMHSCFEEKIGIQQLADTCFMNPFYFLRQFKKQFGITPHQYLTGVRLDAARSLLLQSDKSVGDIVSTIGFEDASSFGKLFRKKFGLSPLQYRQSV